ncbi:hypothetical protein [Nocardioides lianchengensis]|uniref:Immunity protein 8 n=1 Tax=Nocardioides lianchengensis TaxID=1045774 RepID=A0A1G6N7J6_9ACTN|nr:hypothetical protein [Nocardioides lianchengensis]NYG10686.1 hypothetical protein [Nocardioides lianchengensis]SDC63822.1 hypothetical protein SAMN05421872_103171 [Nocardioides lianchengensis]
MSMLSGDGELLTFLVVARTGPGDYPHPVEVAVHPAGPKSRMSFSIGPHAANVGGQIPLSRVLDGTGLNPSFEEEFAAGDLSWLLPYLVRLQAGEDVESEIVEAYTARHGRAPQLSLQEYFDS